MILSDRSTFFCGRDFASSCRANYEDFRGLLDTADESRFQFATATTHHLRYPADILLSAGDIIVVDGAEYKVIGVPEQIGTNDRRANLVRVSA